MLISQLDPTALGTWIMGLVLALSIAVSVATLARGNRQRTQILDQPVQVELAEKFVSREAFLAHVQRVDRIEATFQTCLVEIRDHLSENDSKAEDRSRRLHQRIDMLASSMSEKIGVMQGELKRIFNT